LLVVNMTHCQNWDIEKYKSDHEPKHQWQLKKKFMEFHKDRFPEYELVGLAQTFGNVEFLGCQYPSETMEQIQELSLGVVGDYREQKKGKLQRTFVSCSDAANKKVNRLK